MHQLLKKYDVPSPRYTSYPTVPYWSESPTTEQWIDALKAATQKPDPTWALYVHIPYCESLCTFCGCNTTITRNHDREGGYLERLVKEFDAYLERVPELAELPLRQFHIGGGTPTFFSAENLGRLVAEVLKKTKVESSSFDGSIEVDPRRTTPLQLKTLLDLGFYRVSMGVQDFDPEVQRLINRIQPFEMTKKLTEEARAMGYTSVNYDLIYGLPKQQKDSFEQTILKTLDLRPDRIALYSFALVPWIKPAQRLFKDSDLPEAAEKRDLYELAYKLFVDAGYVEIGMDHFALPNDALARSMAEKKLHRNFMGYTEMRTDILLGIGVSAISEAPSCFHQNEKVLPVYERRIDAGEIATLRGHLLTDEDRYYREQILQFMTQSSVQLKDEAQKQDVSQFLQPLINDGLIEINGRQLKISEKGKPFLRNACMALDMRLRRNKPEARVFSSSV